MFGNHTPTPQTDAVTSAMAPAPTGKRRKAAYLVAGAVSVGAIIWLTSLGSPPVPEDRTHTARIGEIGGDFEPIPVSPPPVVPVATNSPPMAQPQERKGWSMPGLPAALSPTPARPPISIFQASSGIAQQALRDTTPVAASASAGGVESISAVTGAGGDGDRLDASLQSSRDGGTVTASVLPDRNLFITMGAPIPCILEQPINTQVPGPFRCKVKSSVYSTSGAVPLLDPGTWVFGRVSSNLERGMSRAFAVITRLETPQGCLVKLRASLADQLGTPGVEGEVDTHFWERFRGLAMIALLDATSQAAAISAANAIGGDSGVQFNQFQSAGQNLAQGTFGDDTKIPSTLKRGQAAEVLVMAMDDIDMRPCFSLRMAK